MITEITQIATFMGEAFLHIWPYLIITIPIAVAVNMSGASRYIKRAFDAGPVTAILLATLVGAFSPFCSCGVIPVIAALLIGGVPLPPVMAFWIASPSMDPEIFFLSVGMIGWDLALWRLIGTLVMSLAAGFITHWLVTANWIERDILRRKRSAGPVSSASGQGGLGYAMASAGGSDDVMKPENAFPMTPAACCSGESAEPFPVHPRDRSERNAGGDVSDTAADGCGCDPRQTFWQRLRRESQDATLMVVKFMALAFFLEALIIRYVPEQWIITMMGRDNGWAILVATLLGIPVYTSNLSALPMVSGLLTQGMSPGAGLAFLIAGPTTTLPAMAAVWGLVRYRIFTVYLLYALGGAVILGYMKEILG